MTCSYVLPARPVQSIIPDAPLASFRMAPSGVAAPFDDSVLQLVSCLLSTVCLLYTDCLLATV